MSKFETLFLKLRRARGFTLVELMIAVAIVAILASVAGVSLAKYAKKAKADVARQRLAAIHSVLATDDNPIGYSGSGFCPGTIGAGQVAWDQTCETNFWQRYQRVEPANTQFQYAVIQGGPAENCTSFAGIAETCAQFATNPPGVAWFVAIARGDLDGDGTFSTFIVSSRSLTEPNVFAIDELE